MSIPESLLQDIKEKTGLSIGESESLSGGSINRACRVRAGGKNYFLKYNRNAPDDFFGKEADGLQRLRKCADKLIVPKVITVGQPGTSRPGYLLMEFIQTGRTGDASALGSGLAHMHQNHSSSFGLQNDNYIGSLPQQNNEHTEWESFFAEERIGPQLKMAVDSGKLTKDLVSNWNRLSNQLNSLLPKTKPSFLHGDLWSGNYMFNEEGTGVLIDPAVYYGHPEMDLAFTTMFGGFPSDFYAGYRSVSEFEPGFDNRVDIYNLYPLLVHVNLFGGHYTSGAVRFLKQF
ncbi:MAG: fructosamine kinase family protein [Balneolaceae bacterium]